MKCELCGLESELDAVFIKQREAVGLPRKVICPSCWVGRNNSRRSRALVALAISGICGFGLHWVAPGDPAGKFLMNFFLFWVFLMLTILPHELGHALIGRALGWNVHQIVVGLGKSLFKVRWAGMLCDFRSFPVAAVTRVAPNDTRWLRSKWFLIVIAGPLVNLVMALVVVVSFGGSLWPLDLDLPCTGVRALPRGRGRPSAGRAGWIESRDCRGL